MRNGDQLRCSRTVSGSAVRAISPRPPAPQSRLWRPDYQDYKLRQSLVVALRPAELNGNIYAFNVSVCRQALPERGYEWRIGRRRTAVDPANHRHRALLRPRREWPRRRAAEQRDEFASFPFAQMHG